MVLGVLRFAIYTAVSTAPKHWAMVALCARSRFRTVALFMGILRGRVLMRFRFGQRVRQNHATTPYHHSNTLLASRTWTASCSVDLRGMLECRNHVQLGEAPNCIRDASRRVAGACGASLPGRPGTKPSRRPHQTALPGLFLATRTGLRRQGWMQNATRADGSGTT